MLPKVPALPLVPESVSAAPEPAAVSVSPEPAALSVSPAFGQALIPPPPPPGSNVPDWALPQSPTHTQVAPPLDFHRPPRTFDHAVGQFIN